MQREKLYRFSTLLKIRGGFVEMGMLKGFAVEGGRSHG